MSEIDTLPLTEEELDALAEAHRNFARGEWLIGDAGKKYDGCMSAIYVGKLFDEECRIVEAMDDSDALIASRAVNALPSLIAQARAALRLKVDRDAPMGGYGVASGPMREFYPRVIAKLEAERDRLTESVETMRRLLASGPAAHCANCGEPLSKEEVLCEDCNG